MFSASGSIPLAVSATKLGVSEFLRKPIHAEHLREAVEKNLFKEEIRLRWAKGMEWLRGESLGLKKMFAEIRAALRGTKDIILYGELGIPKEEVAEFIHINSLKKGRKLAKIDLSSFRSESLEVHFWATLQELMGLPESSSLQNEKDLCGTIYLENLENLDEIFKQTTFNFFAERKGKIDKSVRAVIGIRDKSAAQKSKIKKYAWIEIPPLRERKEDIPYLLELYLKRSSTKFNKKVKFISTEVLEFLAAYDYPGNYLEFERMIQEAVLEAPAESLELKNFPLDFKGILQTSLKKSLGENLPLEKAKRRFEKVLYNLVLEKSNGEISQAARFLDIPKSSLIERFEDLAD
jgi:DNA-binding NtrC family response regulator